MNLTIQPREYQRKIFEKAKLYNTLVVLPTGLGKTLIAILLIENRLKNYPNSKVLFLAPTKPLVLQHKKSIESILNVNCIAFTGSIAPEKRKQLFSENQIIVATPQTIQNDLVMNNISLENVSLIVFDEAHRAVKDYAYVFIAENYHNKAKYERILGLTASPGHDKEKILEICNNLFIENIEIRTRFDEDVKPYIKDVEIKWIAVELNSEMKKISSMFNEILNEEIEKFNKLELVKVHKDIGKKDLLNLQKQINSEFNSDPRIYEANLELSIIMKLKYLIEVLETQGTTPLYNYIIQLKQEFFSKNSKNLKRLLNDVRFNEAFSHVKKLLELNYEHPKLEVLKDILKKFKEKNGGKAIIFTNIRDEAQRIKEELEKFNFKAEIFIGQGKRKNKGLSQKEQLAVIEKLKSGELDCIIATSIGEEGLDIPEVDLVVFYEPIPSEIRAIQRKGRTGRHGKGEVILLYTKGTIDERYHWISLRREKKMYETLKQVKDLLLLKQNEKKKENNLFVYEKKEKVNNLNNNNEKEKNNSDNQEKLIEESNKNNNENKTDKIIILVDQRERNSTILKELSKFEVSIVLEQLPLADYLVSSKVAIELKKAEDFIASIIDGRLFSQLRDLKKAYEKPILIIVNYEEIYQKSLHINSIIGTLTSVATQLYVPILFARNSEEAARMIYFIAKQEQEEDKYIQIKKPKQDINEQIRFTVATIPGIGYTLSEPLLNKFKTIKNLANSNIDELSQVENIGKIRATKIVEFFNTEYQNK
ncbi:MAG: DEAD/DEAH box helicase [Candidatus Woesearchaeota archaeon]